MIGNEDKELRTDIHHMDKLIFMSQVTLLLVHMLGLGFCLTGSSHLSVLPFMCSWHTLRQLVAKQLHSFGWMENSFMVAVLKGRNSLHPPMLALSLLLKCFKVKILSV